MERTEKPARMPNNEQTPGERSYGNFKIPDNWVIETPGGILGDARHHWRATACTAEAQER